MNDVVQWATILSPIIAVIMAAWVIVASSKDTRKQITELKKLNIMQISNTLDMLELESYKYYLEKEDNKNELKDLHNEVQFLRQNANVNPQELVRLQNKMEKLSKNAQYNNTIYFKIVMRQFELMRGIENIKGKSQW